MRSAERTAVVIICSTRAASGIYEDETGPVLVDWLRRAGFTVNDAVIAADGEPVRRALTAALASRPSVVITSGGTGLSPTDQTPEITAPLLERELPGIPQAIMDRGSRATSTAILSRGLAGTVGSTFVANLPGSPGAVRDGIAVIDPVLDHICGQLEGRREH